MASVFSNITKIGEGYDVAEKDIPIEIQDFKLLEWLISRRKVLPQWKDNAILLPQQLKSHAKNMAPLCGVQVVNRELNYFDIADIMEQFVLEGKENSDKNFFGQFSNEKMRLWGNLKIAYEKNNVHLAEAASNLVQNVKYEAPNLKKSMEQHQKQIQDLHRKGIEHLRNANDFKLQYEKACKDMKIKGDDLRKELEGLVDELPNLFSEVVLLTQKSLFGDAVQFYKSWVSFIARATQKKETEPQLELDVLEYVRKYGNESITKMEKRKNNPNYKSEDDEDQQDGGFTVEESSSGGSIDWGAISSSEKSPNSVNSGVQWDTVPSQPALQWDIGSGSGSSGINWDITIENEGESEPVIQLISDNQEKKSDTILEDSSTRKQFVFSLIELDAFFSQRLQDFSSQSDIHINLNQMPGAPTIIHKHDNPENLKKYSDAIKDVLSFMESEHLQNLLEMKNSKRSGETVLTTT